MNGDFGARHRREPGAWGGRPSPGLWQELQQTGETDARGPTTSSRSPASATPSPRSLPGGCRDRTGEFRAVVTQMRSGVAVQGGWRRVGPSGAATNSSGAAAARARFAQHARLIGADLVRTCAKLEKLALLAKHDRRGPEWGELVQIVGQDVGALNQSIGHLQEVARSGTLVSPGSGTTNGQQATAHSSAVVLALQTRLADMSGRYRDIVESQQQQLAKQPSDPIAMHRTQSDVSIDMSGVASAASPSSSAELHNRQQSQRQLERSERHLTDRADTMRTIEQTMVDLGSVFQQLATIVKEQDELVQRIGASVEDTTVNVEAAHAEMLKFLKSMTSNRGLMLKVFGLLMLFFVLFVVFLR